MGISYAKPQTYDEFINELVNSTVFPYTCRYCKQKQDNTNTDTNFDEPAIYIELHYTRCAYTRLSYLETESKKQNEKVVGSMSEEIDELKRITAELDQNRSLPKQSE